MFYEVILKRWSWPDGDEGLSSWSVVSFGAYPTEAEALLVRDEVLAEYPPNYWYEVEIKEIAEVS